MAPPDFPAILAFFKALANDQRLRMVALLLERRRSVQELAGLLDLREPTVSHHLAVLSRIALVDMVAEGNTHWYRLREDELNRVGRAIFGKRSISVPLTSDEQLAERRILANFLAGERLKVIPASRKKRWTVLRWLAQKFELDRNYSEAAVNEIIEHHHWDSATLRREMIGYRMLARAKGLYRRRPETEWLGAAS
jgi:DNA-binding transcriptional ArsR family regulator